MRPRDFSEYAGQAHLVAPGQFLRRAVEADRVSSLILFGPPGCGKTALAHLIAQYSKAVFSDLNAVTSGVAEIRQVIAQARKEKTDSGRKTLLLIDEIHRFNKVQQSALLPDVEKGNITLVGASTQNPFFSIIPALASRSQIVELKPLPTEALRSLLRRAMTDPERGFGAMKIVLAEEAEQHLLATTEGDARRLLNAFEIGVTTTPPDSEGVIRFDLTVAEESVQKKGLVYENEEGHYNTISAFIKSMRGSDPDAAIYWLAKMIYAGEDPLFIARRMIILAAEDIGNADPRALVVAVAALHALEAIGMPEGKIPLAQAVTYLASAPKSNAAYLSVEAALGEISSGRVMEVPANLKVGPSAENYDLKGVVGGGNVNHGAPLQDAHYPGAKRLGRGKGYLYPHDYPGHFVSQVYLPEERIFYRPSDQGEEKKIAERLQHWREKKRSSEKKQ